jgi:hypothetical protein
VIDRRTFLAPLGSGAVAPRLLRPRPVAWRQRTALQASVGPVLTHYDVDADGAALAPRGAVTLPVNVHHAWPHGAAVRLPTRHAQLDAAEL